MFQQCGGLDSHLPLGVAAVSDVAEGERAEEKVRWKAGGHSAEQTEGEHLRRRLCVTSGNMCDLPGVATTDYHKLGHSEQHKFILSWFWRPEV